MFEDYSAAGLLAAESPPKPDALAIQVSDGPASVKWHTHRYQLHDAATGEDMQADIYTDDSYAQTKRRLRLDPLVGGRLCVSHLGELLFTQHMPPVRSAWAREFAPGARRMSWSWLWLKWRRSAAEAGWRPAMRRRLSIAASSKTSRNCSRGGSRPLRPQCSSPIGGPTPFRLPIRPTGKRFTNIRLPPTGPSWRSWTRACPKRRPNYRSSR